MVQLSYLNSRKRYAAKFMHRRAHNKQEGNNIFLGKYREEASTSSSHDYYSSTGNYLEIVSKGWRFWLRIHRSSISREETRGLLTVT